MSSSEDYGSSTSSSTSTTDDVGRRRRKIDKMEEKFITKKDKFKTKIDDGKDAAKKVDTIQCLMDDPTKVFDILYGESTDGYITNVSNPIIILIALGAIGSGVVSMVLTVSTFVDIASLSLFALAPLVIFQKSKLKNLGGIRGQINKMKLSVKNITNENHQLSENVNILQSNVNDLRTCEGEFHNIVQSSGDQIERLLSIIKEQEEIQHKINTNLENTIMQNVLDAVLSSDTNKDFCFNKKELKQLKTRITNLPGVEFNEINFDKFCNTSSEEIIKGEEIMLMFRNLKDPNVPNEDNIFVLRPEQLIYTSHDSQTGNKSDIIVAKNKSDDNTSPTSIIVDDDAINIVDDDDDDDDDDDARITYKTKQQQQNNGKRRSERPGGLKKGKAQYGSARIHKDDDYKRSDRPGLKKGDAKYGTGAFF